MTLVGERRRADMVLPSDTPIGQLLPDILQLLDDRTASRPLTRQLITSDGSALPHDSTLATAGVADTTLAKNDATAHQTLQRARTAVDNIG